MAAPRYAPTPVTSRTAAYESPAHVPDAWQPTRPAEIVGRQPAGERLGYQGPDQGYALKLAEHLRPRVQVQAGESVDDAVRGCLGIALRRASLYGRAPVMHDLTIAFTIWGFLDATPPADLVAARGPLFAGLAHVTQHYTQARELADRVPEATLRSTPAQVASRYPAAWRELTGV